MLRYWRYLNEAGTAWVRHGAFREAFPDGQVATEGQYQHGLEAGTWRDFYPSGQVAAEGTYANGKEEGWWRFWDDAGSEEASVLFRGGAEEPPSSNGARRRPR